MKDLYKTNLTKSDWYFILVLLVLFALIWLNEIGYGAIAFLPHMLLEAWLVRKAYGQEEPSDLTWRFPYNSFLVYWIVM